MDDEFVVDNAALRASAVAAVMTAGADSSEAEKRLGGSSVGRRPNVDPWFGQRLCAPQFGLLWSQSDLRGCQVCEEIPDAAVSIQPYLYGNFS
jgi:hypothetical protein